MMDIQVGRDVEVCPALVENRCTVYDVRPTICRLWGAGPGMACPWGCEPDVPLTPRERAWRSWAPLLAYRFHRARRQ